MVEVIANRRFGSHILARSSKAIFLIFAALLVSGCSTISYYSQAISGHLRLMSARQPIDELLADQNLDEALREKLQLLVDARVFAVEKLYLPNNDSYSTYVETGKQAVTWNVVATEEFSMQPVTWCFPVAGCVSYRGYFDKADAQLFADNLDEQSYDVTVGGASAYSTLGWFADPILDTMLRGGDIRFVSTLFHELAHQVLYVKDDSQFNEAFATFVEQEGMRQWLLSRQEQERISRYDASLSRARDFVQLLLDTRSALTSTYAQSLPAEDMRLAKQAVFNDMRDRYEMLKQQWRGFSGYDGWFERDLNNARLVAVSTYRRYVPAFQAMYDEADQNLQRFYHRAESLANLPRKDRREELDGYLKEP